MEAVYADAKWIEAGLAKLSPEEFDLAVAIDGIAWDYAMQKYDGDTTEAAAIVLDIPVGEAKRLRDALLEGYAPFKW